MKDWILKHKKLYFFIVGVIAFVAFMAITLHGVKRASAATETVTANIDGTMKEFTVPDIREVDWSYWLTLDQSKNYNNPQDLPSKIISDCSYLIVRGVDTDHITYFFYKEPFYYDGPLSIQANISLNYVSGYAVSVYWRDGVPRVESVAGLFDNSSNADNFWLVMYNGGSFMVGSTYDYLVNCTDFRKDEITRNNLTYPQVGSGTPSFTGYQWETGPYLDFERLYMRNDVIQDSIGFFSKLTGWKSIMDALKDARWQYSAVLKNPISPTDASLTCDLSMNITLPTTDYVYHWFDKNGYDFSYSDIAKHSTQMISEWTKSKSSSDSVTFTIVFNDLELEYDPSGLVFYDFSYQDLVDALTEQALSNHDVSFIEYISGITDERHQFAFMLYMYVESLSSVVKATYEVPYGPPNIVYGRQVVDIFTYGVLNDAISLNVNIDVYNSNEAEIKAAYNDAFKIGYEEHNQQMQDRIDGLEDALDSIYQVDGSLSGDLSATDLWDGFWNLSRGLASLGKSVDNLSSLTGSVFAFMPSPITSIMQYTLIAICVIAIIKAIRG